MPSQLISVVPLGKMTAAGIVVLVPKCAKPRRNNVDNGKWISPLIAPLVLHFIGKDIASIEHPKKRIKINPEVEVKNKP